MCLSRMFLCTVSCIIIPSFLYHRCQLSLTFPLILLFSATKTSSIVVVVTDRTDIHLRYMQFGHSLPTIPPTRDMAGNRSYSREMGITPETDY